MIFFNLKLTKIEEIYVFLKKLFFKLLSIKNVKLFLK
jgi:hypothetical protein